MNMIQSPRQTDAIQQFATSLVSNAKNKALANFSNGISSTSTHQPRTLPLEKPIQPSTSSSPFSQAVVVTPVKTLAEKPDIEEESRGYLYALYDPTHSSEQNEPVKLPSLKEQIKARLTLCIQAEQQAEEEFNQELLTPTRREIEDLYARCSQERINLLETPPSDERDCRIKQLEEKEQVLYVTLNTANVRALHGTKLIFSQEHFKLQLEDKKSQKTDIGATASFMEIYELDKDIKKLEGYLARTQDSRYYSPLERAVKRVETEFQQKIPIDLIAEALQDGYSLPRV